MKLEDLMILHWLKHIGIGDQNMLKFKGFFLCYNNNQCTCNPVGINTFGQTPRKIAGYFKLPNANGYVHGALVPEDVCHNSLG